MERAQYTRIHHGPDGSELHDARAGFIATIILAVLGAVYGIAQIITGKAPVQTLIGLPIGGALAWYHLKAAARLKIPLGK